MEDEGEIMIAHDQEEKHSAIWVQEKREVNEYTDRSCWLIIIMVATYTLPKFWRYNKVQVGGLVPLDNLVDHNRDSPGEFANIMSMAKDSPAWLAEVT